MPAEPRTGRPQPGYSGCPPWGWWSPDSAARQAGRRAFRGPALRRHDWAARPATRASGQAMTGAGAAANARTRVGRGPCPATPRNRIMKRNLVSRHRPLGCIPAGCIVAAVRRCRASRSSVRERPACPAAPPSAEAELRYRRHVITVPAVCRRSVTLGRMTARPGDRARSRLSGCGATDRGWPAPAQAARAGQ